MSTSSGALKGAEMACAHSAWCKTSSGHRNIRIEPRIYFLEITRLLLPRAMLTSSVESPQGATLPGQTEKKKRLKIELYLAFLSENCNVCLDLFLFRWVFFCGGDVFVGFFNMLMACAKQHMLKLALISKKGPSRLYQQWLQLRGFSLTHRQGANTSQNPH